MPSKVKRNQNTEWCNNGYHEITEQAYQGVMYKFGHLGSRQCLLDDELNPVTGNGYHGINLAKYEAHTGAEKFSFTEHLNIKTK